MDDDENEGRFRLKVDGRTIVAEVSPVTATEVAALAGLSPVDAHVLVRTDDGAAARVRDGDRLALGSEVELRSARVTEPWALFVDGRRWDWVAPAILESEVREIGRIPDDRAIFLDGGQAPLRSGGLIDLTDGVPRLSTRPMGLAVQPRGVPVVVNGRPRELADPDASFEDLVRLAFPDLPAHATRTFTVTYRRGGATRPEGSLVPHQAARLAPGAVINVSATDKS